MNLIRVGIAVVLLVTLVITALIYPSLPDQVPSHWNAEGEVDGYLPSFLGAAIIPLIMFAVSALFFFLPRIDPLKANYPGFRRYYEGFILVFVLFLAVIQVQVLLWGLGTQISPNLIYPLIFGALFIAIGFLVEHAEQNWFVGIRTPWTLSSEYVWKKTHALGGRLFKIAGIVTFSGVFFGRYALWFCLVPAIASTIITVIYSYYEYQRECLDA